MYLRDGEQHMGFFGFGLVEETCKRLTGIECKVELVRSQHLPRNLQAPLNTAFLQREKACVCRLFLQVNDVLPFAFDTKKDAAKL